MKKKQRIALERKKSLKNSLASMGMALQTKSLMFSHNLWLVSVIFSLLKIVNMLHCQSFYIFLLYLSIDLEMYAKELLLQLYEFDI